MLNDIFWRDLLDQYGNVPLGTLVKTSMVDYPGHISSVLFLKGCNLRCPYCHNSSLVSCKKNKMYPLHYVTLNELIEHIERNNGKITHFVLSGGEATLHPLFWRIYDILKHYQFKIKLDTNGILDEKTVDAITKVYHFDYYAIDIKTAPFQYQEYLGITKKQQDSFIEFLEKTKSIKNPVEFRTTLYPPFFPLSAQNENDPPGNLIEIAQTVAELGRNWYLQQFKPGVCLDPLADDIIPFKSNIVEQWVDDIRKQIPSISVTLR